MQPSVGIVFLVDDKLYIDSTPLDRASIYGDHLIHDRGHDAYWEELLAEGAVGGEYDDYPRGRAAYNSKAQQFTLLLDRCITRRPELMREILRRMNLPATTRIGGDEHYVCPGCRRR